MHTDGDASVNLARPRRRGKDTNSIYLYAAVNLKRNNRKLRSTNCTVETTDRHEVSKL